MRDIIPKVGKGQRRANHQTNHCIILCEYLMLQKEVWYVFLLLTWLISLY